MPSFSIAKSGGKTGQTVDAMHCDLDCSGQPDPATGVPVWVHLISHQVISVDGEPRRIVSTVHQDAETTYLIAASSKSLRNRDAALPWRGRPRCSINSRHVSSHSLLQAKGRDWQLKAAAMVHIPCEIAIVS